MNYSLLLAVEIVFSLLQGVTGFASSRPYNGANNASAYDCNVYIPFVYVWLWLPVYFTLDENGQSTTPDVRTNAAGTQTAVISVITSQRYEEGDFFDGFAATLYDVTSHNQQHYFANSCSTFPTGLYEMPPMYEWCSSSACALESIQHVNVPTSVPFPAKNFGYKPVQDFDGKGVNYVLATTIAAAGPDERDWWMSAYSDQRPVQSCKPTSVFGLIGKPPIAAQPILITEVTPTATTATTSENVDERLRTFAPVGGAAIGASTITGNDHMIAPTSRKSTKPQNKPDDGPAATEVSSRASFPLPSAQDQRQHTGQNSHGSAPAPKSWTGASRSPSTQLLVLPASDSADNKGTQVFLSRVGAGPSSRTPPFPHPSLTAADSRHKTSAVPESAAPVFTLPGSQVVSAAKSGVYRLADGQTIARGGSAVVVRSTTYSLVQDGQAIVVNGDTLPMPGATGAAVQVVGSMTMLVTKDHVLFDGNTLAATSTLTVGSGSVVTRLALTTDSAGSTFVLGDSITLRKTTAESDHYSGVPSIVPLNSSEIISQGTARFEASNTSQELPNATSGSSADRLRIDAAGMMLGVLLLTTIA
jgi:hypothetical protein